MSVPKTNQEPAASAMVVAEPSAPVVYNLDEFPEARYNRLIPTQTIRMPSDLLVPVVQVVQLDYEADTYKSPDVPAGHRAPNARGLSKLSTAAGVSFFDERREDDGSDPDLIRVSVMASMLLPTGQRITAQGTKQVNLNHLSWASPAQRAKYKSFFYEHVSTRARNRAIRALLSLRSSYPEAEIRRPFAVVSYAPNMDHPAVQERMLDSIAPRAVAALYGPEPSKQLHAGEPVMAVREIPSDEDEPSHMADQTADAEPAWMAAAPQRTLADVLRESADASELAGAATREQATRLGEIFAGIDRTVVGAGIVAVWGRDALRSISAAQAEAIAIAADSLGDGFATAWQAMATGREASA